MAGSCPGLEFGVRIKPEQDPPRSAGAWPGAGNRTFCKTCEVFKTSQVE